MNSVSFLKLSLCAALVGLFPGCSVDFPDDKPYACTADGDCGGDGYVCATLGSLQYCCLPEPEVCGNGIDDNCDGKVDESGPNGEGC
ncbi:hypothetical protein [Stigmatella erecta]|uniref:Putative metal-binding motif-containing protein n=1 Tax=Stigmatella erecta TaxID=83460 RepID=A0A1I0H747_9BACT|nr:hypothetical protein [Stigmatella erecta]SET79465.1 Putative metal-binding motif-containing protein [Stigmatella erecta]